MTSFRVDAYLLPTDGYENTMKKNKFIEFIRVAPHGTSLPFTLDVQWVDTAGNPTKTGSISGTIVTVLEVEDESPVVVFSSGERVSLDTLDD